VTQAKTNFNMLNEIIALRSDIKHLESCITDLKCRIENLEAENFVLEFSAKRQAKALEGLADDLERNRNSRD